ncbi:myosin phosphatase Rho-interacting protein isoform X6 [Falco biarmicus]|uniref:myosin phosphatase Rho-interacting protein isoform X6 n=1 Tax=Falco rusticolus TaxID=120794 RepID=UPI001886A008|nr:myosin phosphatase Rho-interacting protein isoform X6 [Falco rusticolus]XP_055566077.1 myosin phosphatase Rho-interacting protein isoform X7 [Falco cherrug]XP_055662752.1 myosin phosphatase Rho-interacting protein isoform X7 [Falco peregrinus]XP_056194340.1 myosin phosphatase Rho-interacting protein isoform X6 [Falco biarmicus]
MAAKDNPCRKFQANIFNKSKCQNCFKPRESHLLNDEDLNQAKPIYGGWLLLAPEGTDFDNPVHRSRKWQRRFFILYEHGLLRYALDEMPTTLPQGTINMNQCTDVVDGESRTGQKFSLCILTPEKEHFIRAENKEIISGWLEMLIVYPRTNKQNQKKKRKVEPPTPQEPGPAKMAVTSSNIPSAEKVPATKSTLWQEEMRGKDQADGSSSISPAQSPVQGQAGAASSLKDPVLDSKEDESSMNGERIDCGRKTRVESGYFSLEKTKQDSKLEEQQLPPPPSPPSPSTPNNRRSQVIEKFEALDIENAEHMETNVSAGAGLSSETRQGRSEKRVFPRKRDFACEGAAVGAILDVSASPLSPHRRAKSLDRRSTESSMTPDLLNFKKGWLTKQYEDGQWKKHWFVLTDQSLRYYRDSVAEEAADLDGEIDLSTCYDVTEYPVQRNYGFQIHTKEGEFTLSAMTSGIRRNWIQTIMKHVRPTTAPDVTSSLPEEKSKTSSSFETGPKPSEKPDAEQAELDPEQKRSRARERRREGRSKTFDWAEFRPIQQALVQERANAADSSSSGSAAFPRDTGATDADPGELERERARRREERRKRFEMIDTVDGAGSEEALRMEVDRILPVPADIKLQNVHVEIEQRWHQVETTPLREEKQIPITPLHLAHAEDRDEGLTKQHLTTLLEKELEQKQKEALELLEQNRHLQDQLKVALGREQSAREGYVLQATCERGFAAMEETHQKKIEDLQRQHQRELEKLREEKDRLLAEETAATISAIEAMKNAHREELERELEKSQRSQISSVNADIEALRRQYLEELQSVQRELEVLSEQYSQKCLENAHLAQALEAERQALRQCQRENQELNAHNQELNNRLAAEITRLRTLLTGEGGGEAAGSPLTQGKDAYELEVLLRVKESEIQYLKQEISSLKDELQTALRDKKYASDKYKDIYTELSIVKAKADCDISRLKEQLKAATEAQGEKSPVNTTVSGYDIMKSKSNPDFLKKDRSSVSRQLRNIRSKSVIEQVSWDN